MKKWITLIASALLVGVASWAIAAESQPGAPQRRAQRKARPAVERKAPPQQRVAVKEGDSQLYGIMPIRVITVLRVPTPGRSPSTRKAAM